MDLHVYDYDIVYGTDFKLDKAGRLEYRNSEMTHAMVITGVDLEVYRKHFLSLNLFFRPDSSTLFINIVRVDTSSTQIASATSRIFMNVMSL